MSTRIDARAALYLFAFSASVSAAEAPRDFMQHPAELQAAFAADIARPVYVVEATFGPHYAELLVQDKSDPELYDEYSVAPNNRVSRPKPVKVGSVSCPKVRIAFEQLRLEGAAAALVDAQALASGGGFKPPEVISYGPDVFCNNPAWRVMTSAPENSDDILEVLYGQDGRVTQARRLTDSRWKKVDPAALRRGAVAALPAAVEPPKPQAAGDGGKRDFRTQPREAVTLLERTVGAPLRLLDAGFDSERATFKLVDGANKKRHLTYFVYADGRVEQWHAEDAIPFDCNKPFSPDEVPIDRLPDLIGIALGSIQPMRHAEPSSVRIYRSGLCGAPHVFITLEDERATGDVEFDAKGRQVSAKVR